MRFQGKIKTWNQAKGFGFISPNGRGKDLFVHITQFKNRYKKPQITDLVTYEIKLDDKNRHNAVNVEFVGDRPIKEKSKSLWGILAPIFALSLMAVAINHLYQNRGNTIEATIYKTVNLRNYDASKFSCTGKTHCSEMQSCEEAMFYQENCQGTEMDGNNDGIPCEQQWCN